MRNKSFRLQYIDEYSLQQKINQIKDPKEIHKLIKTYRMSEKFIEKNQHLFDNRGWLEISDYQDLSEDFMRKYENKLGWGWISQSQDLSEDFMEEYAHRLSWGWISLKQRMSYDFILRNWDKLDVEQLQLNEKVNQDELDRNGFYVMSKLADLPSIV